MKAFQSREVREAKQHAMQGGQALHLHRIIPNRRTAPTCFVRDVNRGGDVAHLFDQDAERLVRTARSLGVRVVTVERRGEPGQHIDLCGNPLRKAIAMCEADIHEPPLFNWTRAAFNGREAAKRFSESVDEGESS